MKNLKHRKLLHVILENPKLKTLFQVWSHIGVTHDKTNEILASKGIPPIAVNIRVKLYTKEC